MSCILIADDDHLNREMLRDLLEAAGHRVVEAADGDEALRRYRPEHIDLVLSDTMLPRKTGLELIGELRNINHHARVIICGSGDPDELRRARNLGALHTFEKPFRLSEVIDTVQNALSSGTPLGGPRSGEGSHAEG